MSKKVSSKNRRSHQQSCQRFSIIEKFIELNEYFAYLPLITSPTNDSANILLALTYGNINYDPAFAEEKELYLEFLKDYLLAVNLFVKKQMVNQPMTANTPKQQKKGHKAQKTTSNIMTEAEKIKHQQYKKYEKENKINEAKKAYVQKDPPKMESEYSISVQNLQQYQQLQNFKLKYGLDFTIHLNGQ